MKVNTHLAKADYAGALGPVGLDAVFSFNDVDHVMNNFSLRTPPAAGPARWRQNHATSQGGGWSLAGDIEWLKGTFELGVDGHLANHDARITNPNAAAFFVDQFSNARKDRYGTWAEWTGNVARRWDLELGVRYTRVSMNSGEVDGTPAQTAPPATRLRDAFNAADRKQTDDLVDAVAKVGTANGDPNPLEFSNVDAELYGVDLAYGSTLPWNFQLDGILSYVRGKRLDISDNLYRISPLHGRTTLTYQRDSWSVAVEGEYAAAQDDVSATNDEQATGGWGILNIYATWDPWDQLGFVTGVNNVTDNNYADHLAGISRVTGSGVTAGDSVPSPGVSYFIRAVARF